MGSVIATSAAPDDPGDFLIFGCQHSVHWFVGDPGRPPVVAFTPGRVWGGKLGQPIALWDGCRWSPLKPSLFARAVAAIKRLFRRRAPVARGTFSTPLPLGGKLYIGGNFTVRQGR